MMQDARATDAKGKKRLSWAETRLEEQKQSGGRDFKITMNAYTGKRSLTGSQPHIATLSKLSSSEHLNVISLTITCKGIRNHQSLHMVFWTLMHEGKVTLKQNACFYYNIPDDFPEDFKWPPLKYSEEIGNIAKDSKYLQLYILADRESHIIIKSSNDILRDFGNIWQSHDKRLVLKGTIPLIHEVMVVQ